MLFSKLIQSAAIAASLVGSTVANPVQHAHNQHKRGVVVVTETQTVVVTASQNQVVGGASGTLTFSTVDTALAAPSSLSTTISREGAVPGASTASSYSSASTTTLASSSSTAAETSSETSTTSSSSTEASDSSSSSSSASSVSTPSTSGDSSLGKGITYSPYSDSGSCKSLEEVKSDFSKIKDYEIVRIYGVDCNQVENVLQAKADGQKVFLGIYFMDQIEAGVKQIADAVEKYSSWDDVYTVSIGNELVNSGEATVEQVGQYVATGKSALKAAGYSGPIVAADTFIAIINNPGLCKYSDYMAINAHAYFDYYTVAEDAGSWLLLQIQRVWTACGADKNVFVTETGWPSKGDTYGKAVASKEAQDAAIKSIRSSAGNDAILFSAYNDMWKQPGAENCEQYWGIYSE